MRNMIRSFAAAVLAVACLFVAVPGIAQATTRFSLPAQPLADSLRAVAGQTNSNILFDRNFVKGFSAQPLDAEMTQDEALKQLLTGTGLTFQYLDEKTVTIVPLATTPANAPQAMNGTPGTQDGAAVVRPASGQSVQNAANSENKKSLWQKLRLAQATNTESPNSKSESSAEDSDSSSGVKLEEIVVTAQKRRESIQDVPVPVTALDAKELTNSNQLRVQDYYNKVPGLSLVLSGNGSTPVLAIRGVTTGGDTNPTVGVVVDEVSYGASANTGQSTPAVPDVDPGDLARVEVLRGPQGTLYGAASIGGLLKFVTVDPSTDRLSGRVQVGSTSVSHSSDTGYSVRGNINVPLSDTFAVRASGFTLRDPGYIDNAETGERDVNRRDSEGGRLSALWQPSDAFSLKLSALIQNTERQGTEDVDTALGKNPQQSFLKGSGFYERNTEAYSATMTGRLGSAEIVSATGYSIDEGNDSIDFSAAFGGFFSDLALALFGVDREVTVQHSEVKKFTQELRATLPIGERIDWLFGAFYTSEDTFRTNDNRAADSTGNTFGSIQGTVYDPATFEEHAAFTTLTYKATDRLDIQIGGRYSDYRQDYTSVVSGARFGGVFSNNHFKSSDNTFTYLITPRFKISPDLMAYARVVTGYRPGGPNIGCNLDTRIPCIFKADRTQNYDIGLKGSVLSGLLNYDASLYYIDWKDIQINPLYVISDEFGFLPYTDNVSGGESKGMELSVEARPLHGLTLSAWAAYNDAELSKAFPSNTFISGEPGDRLPYSSRFSGNVSLDQDFPLAGGATIFVGGTLSYVGDRKGNFQGATVARETFPSYTQLDLRTGFRYDTWLINLFANNVTDRRGVLRGGIDAQWLPTSFTYIQPRTIGLSLSKDFE